MLPYILLCSERRNLRTTRMTYSRPRPAPGWGQDGAQESELYKSGFSGKQNQQDLYTYRDLLPGAGEGSSAPGQILRSPHGRDQPVICMFSLGV